MTGFPSAYSHVLPQVVPFGVGTTKSSTITFFPKEAAS